jgi:polyisoprenoid-binding protein YceI
MRPFYSGIIQGLICPRREMKRSLLGYQRPESRAFGLKRVRQASLASPSTSSFDEKGTVIWQKWSCMTLEKHNLVRFTIDAKSSRLTVQAFASGFVTVFTHSPKFVMRNFVGEITFSPENMQNPSVHLLLNVRSLELMDKVSSFDRNEIERLFTEVLESNKIPTVEYRSSSVGSTKTGDNMYRVNVQGDLNLHGITRVIGLDAEVVVGEDTLRAQGSFSILQSGFGLNVSSIAGGTLKFKDDLKCEYDLIARRELELERPR